MYANKNIYLKFDLVFLNTLKTQNSVYTLEIHDIVLLEWINTIQYLYFTHLRNLV